LSVISTKTIGDFPIVHLADNDARSALMTSAASLHPEGPWPTAQQTLLLNALLLTPADAVAAWQRWSSSVDFDRLDAGSSRLLPLLYQKRAALEIDAGLQDRLRTAYIQTWQANQIRLHELHGVAVQLQRAGIQVLLLKGAALLLSSYPDPGLRPMADCDLLVPHANAPRAIDILCASGWTPYGAAPHAQSLRHASGFDLDVHWNMLPHMSGPAADAPVWQAATAVTLEDAPVLVPCPADQLMHVCAHGLVRSPTPAIRWIVDAVTLVESGPIDWPRLLEQVQRCDVSLSVGAALHYLRVHFNTPIPEDVLSTMRSLPVSRLERLRHKREMADPDARNPAVELRTLVGAYVRWARGRGVRPTPFGLVRYAAAASRAGNLQRLPAYIVSRMTRGRWRRAPTMAAPLLDRER
jgi:hypothetical protein